jgi:hypothetical protein
MALSKSVPMGNTGVAASYWNIGEKREDPRAETIVVTLYGYPSKTAREADGSEPLMTKTLSVTGEDYKRDMTDKEIYDVLKKTADLDGAKDI